MDIDDAAASGTISNAPGRASMDVDGVDAESNSAQSTLMSAQESYEEASYDAANHTNDDAPDSYFHRIAARRDILKSRRAQPKAASPRNYTFTSMYSVPHQNISVNAIALPTCCSHVFSGGSDGFIRKYSWYSSIRRKGSGPQSPIIKGYWENPSIQTLENLAVGDVSRARFGPAQITGTVASAVAVHSLVVQQEEMFALAGSAEGVVNLFGVRLDEGQCRASLGLSGGRNHERNKPVSALALTRDEQGVVSGAWDSQILHWDLNNGKCTRAFVGHTSQICAIKFRPGEGSTQASMQSGRENSDAETDADAEAEAEAEDETPSFRAVDNAKLGETSGTNGATTSYEQMFDDASSGDITSRHVHKDSGPSEIKYPRSAGKLSMAATLALTGGDPSTVVPVPPALPDVTRPVIPSYTDQSLPVLSEDVFASSASDGECLLWDLRAPENSVRRLDLPRNIAPWTTSLAWSHDGNTIMLGRRDARVDMYDLRKCTHSTLHLPKDSGRVTSVLPLADGQVLVVSTDTVRLWDGRLHETSNKPNVTVIPSISGGATTLVADEQEKYLFAAYGHRGWMDSARDEFTAFEIS